VKLFLNHACAYEIALRDNCSYEFDILKIEVFLLFL
jgi:hypothetical protein